MNNPVSQLITSCTRCGTCCLKGGPVLHDEDKEILRIGHIGHEHLVTIRKGERAYNPLTGGPEPVHEEIIKVIGKGEGWACYFYQEKDASCMIYGHRFLECRLLKCWDTSEIVGIIGKNTIRRADIINSDDPILDVIKTHDQECPCREVETLIPMMSSKIDKSKSIARLTELVRRDMNIRDYAVSELGLRKEYELFIFGRPLFRILSDHGLSVRWAHKDIQGKQILPGSD